MPNRVLFLMLIAGLVWGCATDRHREEIVYDQGKLQKFSYLDDRAGSGSTSAGFLDAIEIIRRSDSGALPSLADLPVPPYDQTKGSAHKYTGIIKNKTRYDVSVPSENSGAALVIPAHSWIEYVAWTDCFDVTAFRNGKPFYCLKIQADPQNYPFMCKKYDFIAEIVKPEPVKKRKPVRKRRLKRAPRGEGVEGYG